MPIVKWNMFHNIRMELQNVVNLLPGCLQLNVAYVTKVWVDDLVMQRQQLLVEKASIANVAIQ
jgi:hypothetical protein